MIKKISIYFRNSRQQFVRYFVIGISGVGLDILSLYALKEIFDLRPVMAVVFNQLLLFIYIFLLNKYWAFRVRGIASRQLVRFLLLMGFNYLFAIGWMWLGNEVLGFNYLLVRLLNIALSVSWNFLLYKHWVFKENRPSQPGESRP